MKLKIVSKALLNNKSGQFSTNVRNLGNHLRSLRDKFRELGDGKVSLKPLEYKGHNIAVVSLENPKYKNALSGKMMVEMAEIVDILENWHDGKAILLKGVGNTFCSGADLTVAKSILSHEEGDMMATLMHDTVLRFKCLPLLSVALSEGQCLGGGAELLLCCDFRLMAKHAVIQFVQAKMGVTPGWGGAAQLVELLGKQQALKILTSSQKIFSQEALNIGLADGVISNESNDTQSQACDWLLPYLSSPPAVIQAMKKCLMGNTYINMMTEILKHERSVFKEMWSGEDNLKALKMNIKHHE